jgi:hypothetical protein
MPPAPHDAPAAATLNIPKQWNAISKIVELDVRFAFVRKRAQIFKFDLPCE